MKTKTSAPNFEIRYDIPIPPRGGRMPKYPFADLAIGGSFEVASDAADSLRSAATHWKSTHEGWDYTIRRSVTGARIFRTAAILACMLLATPAFAWTNTTNGHNNQIVDGGPGAQANQRQSAKGGNASASTGPVTASGGNIRNTVMAGAGGYRQAPDVLLPSIGGGGTDCPTVGFGAGGSGLGGGGGFGPSWISSDCNKRKVTVLLGELYGPAVARAYAEKNIDGVKEAVAEVHATERHPAWCITRDGHWLRDLPECGEKP